MSSPEATHHRLVAADARALGEHVEEPVALVLTSPPYPMIEMWDGAFSGASPAVGAALAAEDAMGAFEAMHAVLDEVWAACFEALLPGGLCCINIGDATRSMGGQFRLFHNHARILQAAVDLGFSVLPDILWRKPTNGPTKFMGSGMLPAGAYVTYEHEYILVLRKGDKRPFKSAADKALRQRSAYFWEERNQWFSDLWEGLLGVDQRLGGASRERSAAFPVELAWRLVHMYSVQGDVVLDPFAGTGTTALAAAMAGRNSLGVDLDPQLVEAAAARVEAECVDLGGRRVAARLDAHAAFVASRLAAGKTFKHHNAAHDLPVTTSQERALCLPRPAEVQRLGTGELEVRYEAAPASSPQ